MSYLFTCPHCKSQTLVGDEYSGLAGDCAVCREAVELPDFAVLGPVDEQPERESWMAHRSVRLAIAGTVTADSATPRASGSRSRRPSRPISDLLREIVCST